MSTVRRILVVDDNVPLAENVAEILEGAGYDAFWVSSAEDALAQLDRGSVDVLITDYRLPGKSGAELIAELRRTGHDVPAMVISAHTDDQTVERAEVAGALDVLPKPIDFQRLIRRVAELERSDAVLIVDDNADFVANLAEALEVNGLAPVTGTSAEEALGHRIRPRLAILDYKLPDRDGIEVARRLIARNPGVHIVFVSAYGEELRNRLDGLPIDVVQLEKPFDVARLLDSVSKVLEARPSSRN